MENKKLVRTLAITPGESSPRTSPSSRDAALRRLAMDLATQFPESPEITAIGKRIEDLLR